MKRLARPGIAALFLFLCTDAGALSPEQCQYFETNGRIAICHATSSARNPYVLLHISEASCVASHAGHPLDFVVPQGSCEQAGTLPEGAPCDATLACSDGLSCVSGTCTPQLSSAGAQQK
jgi:hypothetical protein